LYTLRYTLRDTYPPLYTLRYPLSRRREYTLSRRREYTLSRERVINTEQGAGYQH